MIDSVLLESFQAVIDLVGEFGRILRDLVIPGPVLEWLGYAIVESDRTEQAAREKTIERLRTQSDQITKRIEAMYMDKLDGRITTEFYDERAAQWNREQETIHRKIQNIQLAAPAPIDQAVDALRFPATTRFRTTPSTSSSDKRRRVEGRKISDNAGRTVQCIEAFELRKP